MTTATDRSLTPEWVARHAAFHAALVAACGSRRLLTLHTQLYQQSERYRGLSMHVETVRDVQKEHQALVDAALDRDVDLLVDLTLSHFRETTSLIAAAAKKTAARLG
jgi:DNA-binding GntR family transcriptional regulator